MANGNGSYTLVTYKVEATYGVRPSAASAQTLRNENSTLDLSKDTYQSAERRPDRQLADYRHGMRKVDGSITSDLSPKTYADFFAALLGRDFTAGVSVVGASITVGGVADAWTLTRAAGSYLTDGVKIGDVVRLTAGAFNAANLNKNIMLTAVTATVATGIVLNGSLMVAEGPIASATLQVFGKKTMVPQSGFTDKSFSVEHWQPDVPASEVYTGCKVTKIGCNLPATGMAKIAIDMKGKDMVPGAVQYFTAPVAITTTGAMAAVNGVIVAGGAKAATITGFSVDMVCEQSGEPTVGGNVVSSMAGGDILISGQITAVFDSTYWRDVFINETETSAYFAMTSDNAAASDFLSFCMARIKTGGAKKDGGKGTLTQTIPYQALLNISGGAALATDITTISIQDSAA